jgi:nucleoside-triphosphatase THEP1
MESSSKRILVMGAPGVGKSFAGSFLLDGRNSGRFKSSTACVGGVTKEVRI